MGLLRIITILNVCSRILNFALRRNICVELAPKLEQNNNIVQTVFKYYKL